MSNKANAEGSLLERLIVGVHALATIELRRIPLPNP